MSTPATRPLLALALVAASWTTAAAQAPPTGHAPDTATADTFALPGLVVTATRVPLDREALPTPVTVLSGPELRARGLRTVAAALRDVPGAAVVRAGGPGAQTALFLRGGESDYVKVLVDGVAVNDPGGAFDLASLSMDQVERIEIVRGPTSVLYGSDAVAGVVQIFTRRGSGSPTVAAEVTAGSGRRAVGDTRYGAYDAEAGLYGSAASVSYAVGGGRRQSQGVYPLNNDHASATGHLRLGWTPAPGAELALTSRLVDSRSHFPTDGAGNIVDENAYLDRRLWTTSLEGGWRLAGRLDAGVRIGVVTRDQRSVDERDGPADDQGVFASTLDFEGTRRVADARLHARALGGTLTAGVSWESADAATSYTSDSAFGPLSADADYDRTTTGYYLQLLSRPVDRLHLTAGARLDDSDTYGAFATYRVGVALRVAPGTRVRGAIGTGFREPTFAESFGSGFGDVGNPELDPETSRSVEVGIERDIGPATVAVTGFQQDFDDLIQYTFAPATAGGPNYENVGAARAAGIEFEGRVTAGAWSGSASYAWLHTEVVDPGLATDATFVEGRRLLRRPTHSGALAGLYAFGGGLASVTVRAVGERADVDYGAGFPAPRVSLPAYATVDLAGEIDLPVPIAAARLLLRVENALDADYRQVAGFPAGGRALRVGARVRR